jgi:2-amino-4-hydroxy-6-hydroxymethyldihydropteridine diphosphokinase
LLKLCLELEIEMGRLRRQNKGPRIIDIDMLLFGKRIITGRALKVPHPGLNRRRFVLAPLAQIAADFHDPVSRKPISQLLKECRDRSEVRRFHSSFPLALLKEDADLR